LALLTGIATFILVSTILSRSRTAGTILLPSAGYGTGASYCDNYPGATAIPAGFDDVYACHGSTAGATTFDNPCDRGSTCGTYAWQCVELAARYLWAVHGIWAGPGSHIEGGADLVDVVHLENGIPEQTPDATTLPVAGDVISLGPGGGSDPALGHTAVVVTDPDSGGQFRILSENDPHGSAGQQTLTIDRSGGHNGFVLFHNIWTSARWLSLSPAGAP
jgi:hypothetical protein